MKVYHVIAAETGVYFEYMFTRESAEKLIEAYESNDKRNGFYEPGFYEIVEYETDDPYYETVDANEWDERTLRIARRHEL